MSNEVAADDSHLSRRKERIIAELLRHMDEWHRTQCAAAQMAFLTSAGPLVRDLGFAPQNSHSPGDAVARLLMAFTDLKRGVIDPVLKPPEEPEELETKRGRHELSLHDRYDRFRPAVLMELLIMDGYGVEKAAREVADRTGDNAGAIKRRWRAIKKGGADFYSWDTEFFNSSVAEMRSLVGERGGTSADYIKLANAVLGPTAQKRRKCPQSRTPG